MLPPISVPKPSADHPKAMRAPSPPELPPAERVASNGFGTAPNIWFLVSVEFPPGGMFVFTKGMAPFRLSALIKLASSGQVLKLCTAWPYQVTVPLTGIQSFTEMGIPWSYPRSLPWALSWSHWLAYSRASTKHSSRTALYSLPTSLMLWIYVSKISSDVNFWDSRPARRPRASHFVIYFR